MSFGARPSFDEKNATSWRLPGACEEKVDCPTYFDCYSVETGVLTEGSPGVGQCNCYWALGKDGDECMDRGGSAWIVFCLFLLDILGSGFVFSKALIILIRLYTCKALDPKKPGNQTLLFILPTTFFLCLYQFGLLMANINADGSAFFIDTIRRIATAMLILFLQLASLQIAITWITIGGTAGKKGVQYKNYPPKIKTALNVCKGFKVLTVVVIFVFGGLNLTQFLRLYTFMQFLAISVFYWFGSNALAKMLTPTKGDMSDEKYEQMCAPANAIKKCGHKSCFLSIAYLLLQGVASVFIQSADEGKGVLGICVFEISLFVAIILFDGIVEYCRFGVRKTLAKGKDAGWGANTTMKSTTASSSSVAPE